MTKRMIFVRYWPRKDEKPFDPFTSSDPEEIKDYEFRVDSTEVSSGWNYALLVPKLPEGTTYLKFLSECLVNELAHVRNSMRPNVPHDAKVAGLTEHLIHEALLNQFNGLVGLLQHMVHSSSWQGCGEYFDFDRFEVNRRLEMLKAPLSPSSEGSEA